MANAFGGDFRQQPFWKGGPNDKQEKHFDFGKYTRPPNFGNKSPVNQNDESDDQDRKSAVLAKEVIMFVPIFSGGRSESITFEVNRFIESCQKLLDRASMGEKLELFRCFETRVTGEAYEKLSLHGAKNFGEMKTILLRAYDPQKRFQEFINDVQLCKQIQGENTKDYLGRFEKKYGMACSAARAKYPTEVARQAIATELEQIAKFALKHGVRNPVLHGQLLTMRTESFEALIEEAERFEREDKIHLRDDCTASKTNIDNDIMVIVSEEQEEIRLIKKEVGKTKNMLQEILQKMSTNGGNNDRGQSQYQKTPYRENFQNNASQNGNRNGYHPTGNYQQQNPFRENSRDNYQGNNFRGNNRENRNNFQGNNRDYETNGRNNFYRGNQRENFSENNRNGGNNQSGHARLLECFKCGQLGHFAVDCKHAKCFECNGIDHDFEECIRRGKEKRAELPRTNDNQGN